MPELTSPTKAAKLLRRARATIQYHAAKMKLGTIVDGRVVGYSPREMELLKRTIKAAKQGNPALYEGCPPLNPSGRRGKKKRAKTV